MQNIRQKSIQNPLYPNPLKSLSGNATGAMKYVHYQHENDSNHNTGPKGWLF